MSSAAVSTLLFIVAGLNGILTVFTLAKGVRRPANQAFFVLGLSLSVWTFCHAMTLTAQSNEAALVWERLIMVGAVFIPGAFIIFSQSLPNVYHPSRAFLMLHGGAVLFLLSNLFSPRLIAHAEITPWGVDWRGGWVFQLYSVYFAASMGYGLFILAKKFSFSRGLKRMQLFYVLTGAIVPFVFGMIVNIVLPLLGLNQLNKFGPVGTLVMVSCFSYAIVRYRLLDINLAVRNLTVRLAYLVLAGAPVVAALLWVKSAPVLVMLVLAGLLFGPDVLGLLRAKLASAVDLLPPFRGRYDHLKILDAQEERLAGVKDVKGWTEALSDGVRALFDPVNSHVLLSDRKTGALAPSAANDAASARFLPMDGPLATALAGTRHLIVRDLLRMNSPEAVAKGIDLEMAGWGAVVAVPFFTADHLEAVLLLGPKADGRMYNELDVAALWTIGKAAEFALKALANAEAIVRKERYAVMGEIAAVVGHEFRNALAAMGHSTYILEGKVTDDGLRKHVGAITAQIAASHRIVGDILSYVRNRSPVLAEVNINAVAREALQSVGLPDGIRLRLRLADGLPGLRMDKDEMRRAIVNLLRNAVEAMPQGGALRMETAIEEGIVRLTVADTGRGVPPESLSKLFTPLFSTKPDGTGLGLLVVKSVVERHGGRVTVESREGLGTVFHLWLPVGEAPLTAGVAARESFVVPTGGRQ